MKIAQISPVFPPYHGGIGIVAERYRKELEKSGDDITVLTPRYHQKQLKKEVGVKRVRALFSFGNAAVVPSIFWQVRKFDVIHLHYPFYGGDIFAALGSWFWKKPFVVTYHMKTQADGWKGKIFEWHRKWMEPVVLRKADRVLISSFDYAESIQLLAENLVEMPFDIRVDQYGKKQIGLRKSLGVGRMTPLMVFVGGLDEAHYFKGLEVLLETLGRMKEMEWKLVIVGSGSLQQSYKEQVKREGISDRVIFAGRVSDKRRNALYAEADVHVLPSIDRSEAFGLVTLEAAASGTPSIVSDLPGVRTLVESEKTGWIVEPKNVLAWEYMIREVLHDKDIRKVYGKEARKRAKRLYDTKIQMKKLQALYEEVSVRNI